MSVINPADNEVNSLNRFLNVRIIRASEIRRQHVEAYGEGVTNEGDVCKWCPLFNGDGQICTMKRDPDARLSSP
jgi:hypothetical protein